MKKKKFKSISRKIMLIMLTTISIFSVGVLLFNMTLLDKTKSDVIFHQLKESAEEKRRFEKNRDKGILPDKSEEVWVAHFYMKFDDGAYGIYADKLTQKKYPDNEIVTTIAERVATKSSAQTEGTVVIQGTQFYYYVEWVESGEEAMVFFVSPPEIVLVTKEMLLFLGAAILIAFITSRLIANSIAKQVKGLDLFAEEIARRNWEAPVPKTEQDEIGMLAHSLEKMRDALRAAEERDRQFLQSTSHDLKTPVMVIKGYAQAIVDGVDVAQEQSKAKVILAEAEKLEKRVVQLLRLNTLDQALGYTEEWETVRLDRLVKSVVEKFKVVSPTLSWELELKETEVLGNKEALLIAFENLLDNQCRFAYSKVHIEVDAQCVRITNDGEAFQTEEPQSLFNPLVKDINGKFGLGLAIVQKVIAGHGWTIKAYNLVQGVCFEIQFTTDDI